MLEGMRNFFQSGKVGATILKAFEALGPIEIHYGAGARALETTAMSGASSADPIFMRLGDTMKRTGQAWSALRKSPNPMLFSEMVEQYFRGYNIDEMAAGIHKRAFSSLPKVANGMKEVVGDVFRTGLPNQALVNKRMAMRQLTFGTLGVMGMSNLAFGSDNSLSRTLGFAGQVGMNLGIGATIGAMSGQPLAMWGYYGLAGINVLRAGNNLGPF